MNYGKIAFEAYNKHRGGLNHQGDKTPGWEELPLPIREAWDVAASAAVEKAINGSTN